MCQLLKNFNFCDIEDFLICQENYSEEMALDTTRCVISIIRNLHRKFLRIANIFEDTGDAVAFDLGDIVVILEQRAERVDDDVVV